MGQGRGGKTKKGGLSGDVADEAFCYKSFESLGIQCLCVALFIVCPMLCICIGQNIKSRKRPSVRPSVRPASVDKNVT